MAKVAFITGVNGITGSAVTEYLVQSTTADQWSKIVLTSRSPLTLSISDPRIEFIALDFLQDPKEVAERMRETCRDVTHAYFSSYVHRDDFEELNTSNAQIFENFLNATTAACSKLENVTLQTGGKYYGMHLFPVPTPALEEDPRPTAPIGNFYYPQEDFLASSQRNQKWTWNVIRPMAIVGTSPKPNGMNVALSLAVYIQTCKQLSPDRLPLLPTNQLYWTGAEVTSYAPLIAEMTIWASTSPACANQAFNCANSDHFTWKQMWPRLLEYFGFSLPPTTEFHAKQDTQQKSFTKPKPEEGALQQEFTFHEWSTSIDPNTKRAYGSLCKAAGLPPSQAESTFDACSWNVMDWVMSRTWSGTVTINKARKFGFRGGLDPPSVDSFEAFRHTFDRLRRDRWIP